MNKIFLQSIVIVLLTTLVLFIGFKLGQETQPKYHFDNGGTVSCQKKC